MVPETGVEKRQKVVLVEDVVGFGSLRESFEQNPAPVGPGDRLCWSGSLS